MKRLLTIVALLSLVLAASVALAAPPAGKDKDPASAAEAKAMKACKAERGTTTARIAEFEAKYGTNPNKKNAFGKCMSSKSKNDDDKDEDEADENTNGTSPAKKCKTERGTTAARIAEFEAKYGTNPNKKNAFGKCVSKHAKQK